MALEGAALLEECIERFKNDQGRSPQNIEELVEKGYIDKLPKEPYNGKWVILKTGRVFSTSKFVDAGKTPGKGKTSASKKQ